MVRLALKLPRIRRRARALPTPGAAPGSLAIRDTLPAPEVQLCRYSAEHHEERAIDLDGFEAALTETVDDGVTWLDVVGLGSEADLRRVGAALGLHPLTLEDIAHVHQRPKVEVFEDHLFIVSRWVRLLPDGSVDNEQISMVLRPGLLVSFQERAGDGFDPVRRRIQAGKGAIRRGGSEYLATALLDVAIDLTSPVIEAYSDAMDQIDEEVDSQPRPELARAISNLKRELRMLRRAVWPLRDAVSALLRDEAFLRSELVQPLLRDCLDHATQAADFIDGARERASDLGDRHMAAVAERTNQVMKVLTIVATVFIPLTYLAGIFGMNFDPQASPYNMPELSWRFGYPAFWLVTATTVVGMLWFFRRQGWLGGDGRKD